MGCFSDKSGRAVSVAKHLIEMGLQYNSKNFGFILLLNIAIFKALQYKVGWKLKF